MDYLKYVIIIAVLVVIAIAIIRSKKKDFKLEANKLIILLGGKMKIINQIKKNKAIYYSCICEYCGKLKNIRKEKEAERLLLPVQEKERQETPNAYKKRSLVRFYEGALFIL